MTNRFTLSSAARAALHERTALLLATLRPEVTPPRRRDLRRRALMAELRDAPPSRVWLSMAVLSARLPDVATTIEVARLGRLDGPESVLDAAIAQMDTVEPARVTIAEGETVVDVHLTARRPRFTGIQRVARRLSRQWTADHQVRLVGWQDDMTALIDLTEEERRHVLTDELTPAAEPPDGSRRTVVVPWRGTYLLPEVAIGPSLTPRLQALAEFSGSRSGVVGFDCVPLASSETTDPGTPSHFAGNLAAVRHMDRLAAISHSAAREYCGWQTMVRAAGFAGPQIRGIALATEPVEPDEAALDEARRRFLVGDLPMVLVVGTHEPRKNHAAVLHAAEALWRRGLRFSLSFIGPDGWRSEDFGPALERLQAAGRPVDNAAHVEESVLWAAYSLARLTLFPSLNEGYGLPVAESVAAGTPVVTSNFGSMAEIAEGGGVLLVDPRDDHAIADGVARLLEDDGLHTRLAAEARARPIRTWAAYADEVWAYLTGTDDS